ncbi:hypothetical protein BaRGS_00025851 [Batillaria attramentaria]|uniref:Uncharacterized protein n=1 Tax=Batillaria attramentaria TaxID=370345 RepID=A0ABD0K7G8_9CAEN
MESPQQAVVLSDNLRKTPTSRKIDNHVTEGPLSVLAARGVNWLTTANYDFRAFFRSGTRDRKKQDIKDRRQMIGRPGNEVTMPASTRVSLLLFGARD